MKIHFEYPYKKEIKEGPKFDTDDLFSLGKTSFEVKLAFSRFKERLKLIRNVQCMYMCMYVCIYNMH